MTALAASEEIIDASGAAPRIEAMLPAGVRRRQLSVRTLLAGMCLTQAGHRPAHLTRVHQALTSLPEDEQRRLGVIADWKHGPHQLTYRQTEYTFGLVADALAEGGPGGLPSGPLQAACDGLLEASVPGQLKDASRPLAVDWTDLESFSRPPPRGTSDCADPQAWWGHRKNNLLRSQDELFYGYYLSAAVMMAEENGPAVAVAIGVTEAEAKLMTKAVFPSGVMANAHGWLPTSIGAPGVFVAVSIGVTVPGVLPGRPVFSHVLAT
jgi:hypothetical protein